MTQKAPESGTQAPATATPATAAPANDAPLTRADVSAMIAEGIAAGLAAANVTRADPLPKTDEQPATGTSPVAPGTQPAPAAQPLSRSDVESAVSGVLAPMIARMEALEGKTIVRSDAADPVTAPVVAKTAEQIEADKKSGEIFRGSLGSILGRTKK